MRTLHEKWLQMPRFYLPEDQDYLKGCYMSPKQAMKKWGVSKSTIYRWMREYPEKLGLTHIGIYPANSSTPIITQAISAKVSRPEPRKGNPRFTDGEFQSRIAAAREDRRRKAHPQT